MMDGLQSEWEIDLLRLEYKIVCSLAEAYNNILRLGYTQRRADKIVTLNKLHSGKHLDDGYIRKNMGVDEQPQPKKDGE